MHLVPKMIVNGIYCKHALKKVGGPSCRSGPGDTVSSVYPVFLLCISCILIALDAMSWVASSTAPSTVVIISVLHQLTTNWNLWKQKHNYSFKWHVSGVLSQQLLGTPYKGPNLLSGVTINSEKEEKETKWKLKGKLGWPVVHGEQRARRPPEHWCLMVTCVLRKMVKEL